MRRGRASWARLALWLVALLPAACGPRAQAPKRSLTLWVTGSVDAVTASVRRFEAVTPGVVVDVVALPVASADDSLAAALAANRAPDLCQLREAQLGPLMGQGVLTDWSAGVADLRDSLRGWELVLQGDAIVGLPWRLRTQVLCMDPALAARARLDRTHPPATWDELRTAATAIQRLGHGVHGVGFAVDDSGAAVESVMPFLWSGGGVLANATRDTSWLDSPANRAALDALAALRPAALLAPQDSLERAFVAGRLGLLLADPGFVARARAARPVDGPVVGGVPAWSRDSLVAIGWLGGEVLASFASSRHKEDALKLARFLVRPEESVAIARAAGAMQSSAVAADTAAWVRTTPEGAVVARQLVAARALPPHPQWPAMARVLAHAFADVLTGRATSAQALATADTTFAARLRQR